MKLSSPIREMWTGIICIIGRTRTLDGWELYRFIIRGPLIVGAALSAITSLVHIFLKVAWVGKFTKLPTKRTTSINTCLHQHGNAKRQCTTPLCSLFKTSDEWDFYRKVDRTRWPCSLASSFTRSNITRLPTTPDGQTKGPFTWNLMTNHLWIFSDHWWFCSNPVLPGLTYDAE